jgi:hypothetical protein
MAGRTTAMNELLLLIGEDGERREVFAKQDSIGMTEFYQAAATDYRPEFKFTLADYYDYNGETFAEYDGKIFRVMRTYRKGQEIELTLTRASLEEVEMHG